MALMPKRVKYRKHQRGRIRGNATRGNRVVFGEYGLQATEGAWISAQQIEACRIAVAHFMKREGRLWIRIFPHKSVSATPAETRMGKGKGEPSFWAAVVKPGTVMFELAGVSEELAREAFYRVSRKLPIPCRMIKAGGEV